MNDSLAVNYDLDKCTVLYEKAMLRCNNKRLSSSSDEIIVCSNSNGNIIDDLKMKLPKQQQYNNYYKKKVSIQPSLSNNIDNSNCIDEESIQNYSKNDDLNDDDYVFEHVESVNPNMGDIKSWYSEI